MITSTFLIKLRRITRKLGLNRLIGSFFTNESYEDRFGSAIQAKVRQGDVVWDVGANLGFYTEEFLSGVGESGVVFAFEPVPALFQKLGERFNHVPQVSLMNMAVGAEDGHVYMVIQDDPLAATHRIVSAQNFGERVLVRSASSLVRSDDVAFPNLVKIDVEGHQGAVIDGMQDLLGDPRLHCIGIEVHFGLLDERGESLRPKEIEETLLGYGYRVQWTDHSYIIAER